jgi:serine/threonine protein kinase
MNYSTLREINLLRSLKQHSCFTRVLDVI